jgi:hypothetical protein
MGVKLDETLNWDEHIEMVFKKVRAGIGILKRIKPYVPANTLISIYNALIQRYFDYCSPLWGVCNKTLRDNLQKFQKNNNIIIIIISSISIAHISKSSRRFTNKNK